MLSPDRKAFLESAESGSTLIPVACSWPADLETPLTTWLKVGDGRPPGVLLESVEGGETLGRWSVVACDPLWTLSSGPHGLQRVWRDGHRETFSGNPFDCLRACLSPYIPTSLPGLPPLGQLYGMWGYELIRWIEPTVPVHQPGEGSPPDGVWMLMDSILIFDQVKRLITAVAYGDLSGERGASSSPEEAWDSAMARINALRERMAAPLPPVRPLNWLPDRGNSPKTTSNRTREDFHQAVDTAKEHIAAGDAFQLVISQRLSADVSHPPLDLYRSLRMINPSPYMAFFDFGDWQLIGSSPEVMVKAEPDQGGIRAVLRPIAGTRPRGANSVEDRNFEADLLADPRNVPNT